MDKFNVMRTFLQVAEMGSFSKAASAMGLSKASVSKQISALESSLGAQLFIRTTRQVRLTDNGRYYLAKCRDLLAELEDIEATVSEGEAALHGLLRVAAPQTFSELYLGPAVEQFLAVHPNLKVELTLQDRFIDFIEQRIDVGIRISTLEDSTLIARRLAVTSIVACASEGYLALHGRPQTPEDLKEHQLILDSNFRVPNRWDFNENGQLLTIRVDGQFTVNSAILARDMAIRHGGITLLPAFVIHEALRKKQLSTVLEAYQGEPRGIYALYPQQRHVSKRVRTFVEFLAEYFAATTF